MSWLSSFTKKVVKEWDSYLDDQLGIDNQDIRSGIMIAGSALAGGAAGAAVGGALAGGAIGGVGLAAGTATTVGVGVATGAGAVIGANVLANALTPNQISIDAEVSKGFPLPTNFDLTIGSGELKSNLAAKRQRGKSRFSGGLTGGTFAAPTLLTA